MLLSETKLLVILENHAHVVFQIKQVNNLVRLLNRTTNVFRPLMPFELILKNIGPSLKGLVSEN